MPLASSEPAGYQNMLRENPAKRLLLQYGLGDAQVSWLSAYANMRGVGARVFRGNAQYANETMYGFDMIVGETTTGSVGVGYDFGSPQVGTAPFSPSFRSFTACAGPDGEHPAQQRI